MQEIQVRYQDRYITCYIRNTVVVGTGAAGFNAADCLYQNGQEDIAIVTEGVNRGTSRNTGSDKQTYYKLTLSGDDDDSVGKMAQTLFEGQGVDGDIALCEAALSAQSFLKLVQLGVAFPRNRWGEYIGYKTDHDPRRRATSAGPYTSKMMTECLEKEVRKKGIRIFNGMQVVSVLSDGEQSYGLICLDCQNSKDEDQRFVAFCCRNIIWATGGPAGMYADSVYPLGHYGATGVAFAAGVKGKNLTEWQYGLASVKPRWNVSGTYMQVLPRFISREQDGSGEREFLFDFFENKGELLTQVFLKGYQWPFDVRKIAGGSSIIDILVYLEKKKGRRVFLDFRSNPGGGRLDFSALSQEAFSYLEKAGGCFGTPYERLMHMNAPAVEFYRDKGVDLAEEPLEIALCAQHNNGGLSIDAWWQTNIKGFFAVGEVAASHGVYRPGGSALNAGQVGSARAAAYVSAHNTADPDQQTFFALLEKEMEHVQKVCSAVLADQNEDNVDQIWDRITSSMSQLGASIRSEAGLKQQLHDAKQQYEEFTRTVRIQKPVRLRRVFQLENILLCQQVYLEAMLDYIRHGGKSRGSTLYTDLGGVKPYDRLPEEFTFQLDDGTDSHKVQEVVWQNGGCQFSWRMVRPIPEDDDFFENVWRSYRENQNIF
ncbi:MAG: FAD-binding protein [Lachnospiraceae bacterium]|nr:FAD-binding protein [Lachnospiraceae bacterium]